MVRSGLILGIIAFIYLLVTNVVMVICTPFEAVCIGILAGALAGILDKPANRKTAIIRGAIAGLIAGIGGILGNLAGQAIRDTGVITPQTITNLTNQLGGQTTIENLSTYTTLGVLICCLAADLVLVPASGALGGLIWWMLKGKRAPGSNPNPPNS